MLRKQGIRLSGLFRNPNHIETPVIIFETSKWLHGALAGIEWDWRSVSTG
jgi:hypothetical protein